MVMVPVPVYLAPLVHQMLASHGVPSTPQMPITGQHHLGMYTWHQMSSSEFRRAPTVPGAAIHAVVEEVFHDAHSPRVAASEQHLQDHAASLRSHGEFDGTLPANIGGATHDPPTQSLATVRGSAQAGIPNFATLTNSAVTSHTLSSPLVASVDSISADSNGGADDLVSVNGPVAAEGIATAEGVATPHGILSADGTVTTDSNAQDCKGRKRAKSRTSTNKESLPRANKPRAELIAHDFAAMEAENEMILAQDESGTWDKGVRRFHASADNAARVLAWVVENTSRKLSVVATDALLLDGFHEWDAVHATTLNDARQLQHTFVIARAQRRAALRSIPGFAELVAEAQEAIESMQLADAPEELEWLTGHILNQGDVNARFEYHRDTNEERNKHTGRRDRRVVYTAIVKLNRGGCTSMEVCGQPEVFYHSPGGSGVIFRSKLHHRTEKAEQGIWKLALFFGVFL